MASLAGAWNDQNNTSVAVFPSDGTKFLYHQHRSIRDGGAGDRRIVRVARGDRNRSITDINLRRPCECGEVHRRVAVK